MVSVKDPYGRILGFLDVPTSEITENRFELLCGDRWIDKHICQANGLFFYNYQLQTFPKKNTYQYFPFTILFLLYIFM
jgi:hypothetical protein